MPLEAVARHCGVGGGCLAFQHELFPVCYRCRDLLGMRKSPLFAFMHGTAAVGVFFALSGYVLTRRYFETGEKRILIIGALKRWFSAFFAGISQRHDVMAAVRIFHLYKYEEAANISRSGWLISFGFSMRPPFDPTFWKALQGRIYRGISITTNNSLNPILWTIHLELIGSFVVFALCCADQYHLRAYPLAYHGNGSDRHGADALSRCNFGAVRAGMFAGLLFAAAQVGEFADGHSADCPWHCYSLAIASQSAFITCSILRDR